MNAWLIYDPEGASRNADYIRYHHEIGEELGIRFKVIIREEDFFHRAETGLDENKPDFVIVRTIDPQINRFFEEMGIPVFNPYQVSYITNHKGRCAEYVRSRTKVPVIPTRTIDNISKLSILPVPGEVIKPASGHGGRCVRRVGAEGIRKEELEELLREDDLICQPYVKGPGEDVRVYVIGREVVAAVKRKVTDPADFRANASLGGEVTPYELNDEEKEYVRQICDIFEFGMAGIDFIIDSRKQFIFSEIEDVVGARMLYRVMPETDILRRYLKFICSS